MGGVSGVGRCGGVEDKCRGREQASSCVASCMNKKRM